MIVREKILEALQRGGNPLDTMNVGVNDHESAGKAVSSNLKSRGIRHTIEINEFAKRIEGFMLKIDIFDDSTMMDGGNIFDNYDHFHNELKLSVSADSWRNGERLIRVGIYEEGGRHDVSDWQVVKRVLREHGFIDENENIEFLGWPKAVEFVDVILMAYAESFQRYVHELEYAKDSFERMIRKIKGKDAV